MWEYTDKVKEFFLHPKNIGEIENPDAVGDVGSTRDKLHLETGVPILYVTHDIEDVCAISDKTFIIHDGH